MSSMSALLSGRSEGSFAIAFCTMASTMGGSVSSHWQMGLGSSCRCFSAMLTDVSPVKGSSPVSIS